jgi:hypothetical protein
MRVTKHFLKGPIPWSWLRVAIGLPGRSLVVGLVIWLWAGMTRSATVRLSYRSFPIPMGRFTIWRALRALEDAGLVTVRRFGGGRPPQVTIRTRGR